MRNWNKYWNNTSFADWIRGAVKPLALTAEGWDEWNNNAKQAHPVRYWIAEDFLRRLDECTSFIPDRINDVRYYINNRFSTKSHTLTSSLKKGAWHEMDDRILYCLMDELANYVEIDLAWMMMISHENKSKYYLPWHHNQWYTRWIVRWRSKEAGLDYLDWASALVSSTGEPTEQAKIAIVVKRIYTWWSIIRPNRVDPYIASYTSALHDEFDIKYGKVHNFGARTSPEDEIRLTKAHQIEKKIEKDYYDEDTKYLNELIEHRQGLWT